MPTLTLTLPRPHVGQLAMLREARRYNVAACGRRFGKSTLALELMARPALEGQPVAYFSPTYKLLTEVWRYMEGILQPVIQRSNMTERRIELITGGVIECWSMDNPDAGRSRRYARVVVDEAGLVADLGERWQAAIRPTLADLRGDAWLMGTPKGRNFFHECYQRGLDDLQPDWMAWQKPTSANPHIHPDEITAMRAELTERRFAQEILAQFLDDAGGVFRGVMACATATRQDGPIEGHHYVMGVDLARRVDFTVCTVIDTTTHQMVAMDRFNQIDWSLQVQRIKTLALRFNVSRVIVDQTGVGDPVVEQLQRELSW
jgi:hypothetical protein